MVTGLGQRQADVSQTDRQIERETGRRKGIQEIKNQPGLTMVEKLINLTWRLLGGQRKPPPDTHRLVKAGDRTHNLLFVRQQC